jgi:hypothetical protein
MFRKATRKRRAWTPSEGTARCRQWAGEALEAAPVPEAVTDLVEERLGRLDTDTERLLPAVAAIGPEAPVGRSLQCRGRRCPRDAPRGHVRRLVKLLSSRGR